MNNEIWLPVIGHEGRYMVSNMGRVKTLVKRSNIKNGGIISQFKTDKGYLRVRLEVEGKRKKMLVHRLVATAFIPNPGNKPQVNHVLGIKTDNRSSQLEWVTQEENTEHAILIGLNKSAIIGRSKPPKAPRQKVIKKIKEIKTGPPIRKRKKVLFVNNGQEYTSICEAVSATKMSWSAFYRKVSLGEILIMPCDDK